MASSSIRVFSLQGKSLKLDSRSDIEPYLNDVDPTLIEEIHLGGNTIGVEAAKSLADFLAKATVLKVCGGIPSFKENNGANLHECRSQISQTSLPVALSPKYPLRCPRFVTLSKTRLHSSSST